MREVHKIFYDNSSAAPYQFCHHITEELGKWIICESILAVQRLNRPDWKECTAIVFFAKLVCGRSEKTRWPPNKV